MNRTWPSRVGWIIVAIAVINFLTLLLHIRVVGGSATAGGIRDGNYYVRYNFDYISVTRHTWLLLYYHQISTYITHVLGTFIGPPLIAYARMSRLRPTSDLASPDRR